MWQQLLGRVISRNTLLGNAYSALSGDRDNMGHALVILCRAAHHLYASAINKDMSQTKMVRMRRRTAIVGSFLICN